MKVPNKTEVVRWMNSAGHRTTRGGQWAVMTLSRWLDNPKIAGLAADPETGELVETGLAYVITPDEYHRLKDLPRGPERSDPFDYMLSEGGSDCGLCRHPLVGARANNRTPGYRCLPNEDGGCGKVRITAGLLEDYVGTYVVAELSKSGVQERLIALRKYFDEKVAALRVELDALMDRSGRLSVVYLDSGITQADYRAGKTENATRLRDVRKQLRFAEQAANAPVGGVENLVEWWNTAPVDSRRALCTLLLEKVEVFQASKPGVRTVEPGRVVLHWRGANAA
ncbi:hypothetical protein [Streptomyces beijiangensis]|uniref:Recombinase n=2 Tax=Streptomyces beijiangensis TaxID=163361 RepID=A0A939JDV1_9ACTN|nr:hypothetical protein [Streptomyces beijiangensis]MBO0512401.1 hypothetical protein [Streptomyces beijiangensis]